MKIFLDRLLLCAAGGVIIFTLFYVVEQRRIRWERSRGLYAREAHVVYVGIRRIARSLWKHSVVRCVILGLLIALIIVSGIFQIRSLRFGNGWLRSMGLSADTMAVKTNESISKEMMTWIHGLEEILDNQGLPAYCGKVRSEMTRLREIQHRTVFEQVKMRSLSQDWIKRCENSAELWRESLIKKS